MEFAVGDVVVLKSGGPHMTVSKVDGDSVCCEWSADGEAKRGVFSCVVLERYKPAEPRVIRRSMPDFSRKI